MRQHHTKRGQYDPLPNQNLNKQLTRIIERMIVDEPEIDEVPEVEEENKHERWLASS